MSQDVKRWDTGVYGIQYMGQDPNGAFVEHEDYQALLAENERLAGALRELSEVCRAAIKAGDWKVDGACDPDSLLSHADAAIYCDVTDYARANMEPLIAENERLRAEVAMLTHAVEQGHATIKLGHQLHDALASEMREAGVVVESDPIRVVNRRAERLAEALRGGVTMLERLHGELGPCEAGDSVWDVRDSLKGALARAALDQEGGNG